MNRKFLIITLISLAAIWSQAAEVKLTDLSPAATEFGMVKDPQGFSQIEGAGKMDLGPFTPMGSFFWKDNRKIVKAVDLAFKFKDGERYNSRLENVFAVGGEFITGVGLWVKSRNMYHWVEYDVPAGTTRFTGHLYVSDDVCGYIPHSNPMNQEFSARITADDKDVFALDKQRLQVSAGGGEKLADLDFAIPPGTKRLRFRLQASAWGDGNNNIELILNDGRFVTER